ncbi:MAG: lipopolysaccharide heptosyltransferase II [Phycisphaerales bacterium]|nr:lipopolysaccharide heptosyltransferase II [Phycisphaerales bacterium]
MPAAEPTRLLVVLPSWVGDAIMATPALRLLRDARPGALIGVLARPGIDSLLDGAGLFDEAHVERGVGVMAPKLAAAKVRARRYHGAILLKNSFSSALAMRLAGIPRRTGYARDARSMLLTDALEPPLLSDGNWAIVPAVDYYLRLMRHAIDADPDHKHTPPSHARPAPTRLELAVTPDATVAGAEVLARAGVDPLADTPLAILNPGGNNPTKRWPIDRFAAVADYLSEERGLTVLINGSPAEADLADRVARDCRTDRVHNLARAGISLTALKAIVARCRVMVTNDTGPRHIAVALGVPVVTLFGPTDHRWTSVPCVPLPDATPSEAIILADPTLPDTESANDHPERCRIERITTPTVIAACARLLDASPAEQPS